MTTNNFAGELKTAESSNRTYIMEKLGVHSKQELITLVRER